MPGFIKRVIIISFAALLLQQEYSCKGGNRLTRMEKARNDSLAAFPYWIAMMDSPNVNYFVAVDAFNKYWEHREKPAEDDGEARNIYGEKQSLAEKEKEAKRPVQYVYEYKRFLNWEQRNKNLVKPDGTIMTPEEIMDYWKKYQNDSILR